ncbi:MAG: DUF167 domain-containing protein [Candidatus Hydrogenedentes bacterium]|nr:DUF167 domain-containing protein [Candidatus Hydrogenedentota bacterium]
MDALEKRGNDVWVHVRVQPKASRNSIHLAESRIRVALTAPPVDGAANDALVAFLAKTFGLPRRSVALVQGEKSRDKIVRIMDTEVDHIAGILSDTLHK